METYIESTMLDHIQMLPDHPDSLYKSMGPFLKSKMHTIHTAHGKYFLHKKIGISITISYNSIQTSVSCVNIVLFRSKLELIPRYLEEPDPFRPNFK